MLKVRIGNCVAIALACGAAATCFGQQGGMGGGGGFGGGGNFQGGGGGGPQQQNYERSTNGIDSAIRSYLTGEEIKNILTPGEYSEWPLTLKEGQVIIAEARSDAFDPALEVVGDQAKVLASNDDRYPGDQRPLLIWRCEKDGSYAIRGRCFHDKSGGQFFLRFRILDSINLDSDKAVEKTLDRSERFLLRIPMKAGQIKSISFENPDRRKYIDASPEMTISPTGLPDIGLSRPLRSVAPYTVMAPVDGDYYVASRSYSGTGVVRAKAVEIVPATLKGERGEFSAQATSNSPVVWRLSVKAGEILQASTPELFYTSTLVVDEEPDITKYDLKKPEANPFFPSPKEQNPVDGPPFAILPGRARDGRFAVFVVTRDANLWIATSGRAEKVKPFTLTIKPAPQNLQEAKGASGRLVLGNTDYWAFDAKVGDVMKFSSTASGFAEKILVRGPGLAEIHQTQFAPDQTSTKWEMITSRPGRYLVAVSCLGDGGGGDYSLSRQTFPAKEFGKNAPVRSEISGEQVQIWKLTAKPDEPLMIRWKSTNWAYSISIQDEEGSPANFPMTQIDGSNRYGILKVQKPTTFLIVLLARGGKSQYSIEAADLPGYVKGR